MNLPNAVTAARIAVTPLIAWLPLAPSSALRVTAFVLFVVAAVTDYVDGRLARSRKQETDLGRLLDPLADKLLLVATILPMYLLMRPTAQSTEAWPLKALDNVLPFRTPFGDVPLAWWVVAVVLGRELFMTIFRQAAARRGVVISAIGPAKWKTGFQSVWVGSAYFWFFAATMAATHRWDTPAWNGFAYFNGIVGVTTMIGAIALTLYSLVLYLRTYGRVFTGTPVRGRG
ncbi:MAG TPA: CDP-alcohol phosphatidyltransferase family protein [Gemmatimonadaceae bacterium]|nr:CDP-alcohol phosphatidyltransferase family protein [Gemmatimonadaceae bacterium]